MFEYLTVSKLKNKLIKLEKEGYGDEIVFDSDNEDYAVIDVGQATNVYSSIGSVEHEEKFICIEFYQHWKEDNNGICNR